MNSRIAEQAASFDVLDGQQYMSLTTFRKSGTGVATPVWFVRDGARLVVTTQLQSGKAKRIRSNPQVTVAPCTASGQILGPAAQGCARFLEGSAAEQARALLRRKYGLIWTLFNVGYRLRGLHRTAGFLEIVPDAR